MVETRRGQEYLEAKYSRGQSPIWVVAPLKKNALTSSISGYQISGVYMKMTLH
jgi:hypothetical protein